MPFGLACWLAAGDGGNGVTTSQGKAVVRGGRVRSGLLEGGRDKKKKEKRKGKHDDDYFPCISH